MTKFVEIDAIVEGSDGITTRTVFRAEDISAVIDLTPLLGMEGVPAGAKTVINLFVNAASKPAFAANTYDEVLERAGIER